MVRISRHFPMHAFGSEENNPYGEADLPGGRGAGAVATWGICRYRIVMVDTVRLLATECGCATQFETGSEAVYIVLNC